MKQLGEALGFIREANAETRSIEGIAVPYGVLSNETELTAGSGQVVREVWAPGSFAQSVGAWMSRGDGARMAYRSAHGEKPIGVVTHLADTPEGVAFRATIKPGQAGDDYLSDVAMGLNGVSAEGMYGKGSRRKGATILHREGRLMAIAGSVTPAYDGARIALRDMEDLMGEKETPDPTPDAATPDPTPDAADDDKGVTVTLTPAMRDGLERIAAGEFRAPARVTRPDLVYKPGGEHSFLRDTWKASALGGGDAGAHERLRRHGEMLADIAITMERAAYAEMFGGVGAPQFERAGDVLSSEIPGAYPNDYLPGLLTPRIFKGRPMGGFYQRIPIADARPRVFPKVTTSTTVAVQSAEGAALSSTDLATTAVTITPSMYGAYTDISRQALDGADPSVLAMVYQDLIEAYAQASETVIKTAVEAGSTDSGVAITAATPYAGVLANVVNYYGTRFTPATGIFSPSAAFSTLLSQADTAGRPLVPQLGAVNSDGTVNVGSQIVAPILSANTNLSYASTVNVWVFGVPSDFVIFESSIATFQYDQVVGPQAVRVGLWAYLGVGTRLGSLKRTAA